MIEHVFDQLVTPAGWPAGVRPPGAPDWERTATNWLLDQVPPEYRSYAVLRAHPVLLARFANLHVAACQASVREGLSRARGELREVADEAAVEAAVQAFHREEARLIAVRRAAGLVEEALRGRQFRARL